jgi:hypothetical protein
MRLYADFALLNGVGGPSGIAHRLLVEAGHRPEVEYVPCGSLAGAQLPVLVLDAGNVIATLPGILAWLTAQGASGCI